MLVLKKSPTIRLTIVAAMGLTAHAQKAQDPCSPATFSEQACQAAVQNRGYCWNGRWVKMKYRNPYPYFYDSYQGYVASGGSVNAAAVGTCGPFHGFWRSGASHGFGATGSCHGNAHG